MIVLVIHGSNFIVSSTPYVHSITNNKKGILEEGTLRSYRNHENYHGTNSMCKYAA